MGTYREIKGDLLELFDNKEFDLIAHSANCQKTMGAGIAKQIKDKYITAYLADWHDSREPLQRLGDYSFDPYAGIFNLYTQYNPGKNVNYNALSLCLSKIAMLYSKPIKIGLPQLSCGIAGGDWNIVKKIIQKELRNFEVTVVIYDRC